MSAHRTRPAFDEQTLDLLAACYERNIHSRGDMEYAFQPWAIDVDLLAKAIHEQKAPGGRKDCGGRCLTDAKEIAAEYSRLASIVATDR